MTLERESRNDALESNLLRTSTMFKCEITRQFSRCSSLTMILSSFRRMLHGDELSSVMTEVISLLADQNSRLRAGTLTADEIHVLRVSSPKFIMFVLDIKMISKKIDDRPDIARLVQDVSDELAAQLDLIR